MYDTKGRVPRCTDHKSRPNPLHPRSDPPKSATVRSVPMSTTMCIVPVGKPVEASASSNRFRLSSNPHASFPRGAARISRDGATFKCRAQFSEESKNPTAPSSWNKISSTLVQQEVKILTSEQLIAAQSADVAVVDVRPAGEWEEEHIPGSVNIQLYRPIEGWSAFKIARRMSFAAFGVFDGTEINDNFLEEVADVASKEDPIILVCGMGGSLDKTTYFQNGTPTRSLIAAYELVQNGYQDVRVHKGGVKGWGEEERQFYTMNYEREGEEE